MTPFGSLYERDSSLEHQTFKAGPQKSPTPEKPPSSLGKCESIHLVHLKGASPRYLAGTMNVRLGSLNSLSHPYNLFGKLGVSQASIIRMRDLQGRAVKRFAIWRLILFVCIICYWNIQYRFVLSGTRDCPGRLRGEAPFE